MAFVYILTDERLNGHFDYTSTEGTPYKRILWHAIGHLVNQVTQHRSEAAVMLTNFGHSPEEVDLIYFLSEM